MGTAQAAIAVCYTENITAVDLILSNTLILTVFPCCTAYQMALSPESTIAFFLPLAGSYDFQIQLREASLNTK